VFCLHLIYSSASTETFTAFDRVPNDCVFPCLKVLTLFQVRGRQTDFVTLIIDWQCESPVEYQLPIRLAPLVFPRCSLLLVLLFFRLLDQDVIYILVPSGHCPIPCVQYKIRTSDLSLYYAFDTWIQHRWIFLISIAY
jgi:hypothetical protein